MDTLDLAALRTFVSAVDLGGYARAARLLHRTPGAVSLQMKTLEDRLGAKLFERHGKTMAVSPHGELLLTYARKMLLANDEAILALSSMSEAGVVRLGIAQDLAESVLSDALASFSRAMPSTTLDVRVGRSCVLERLVLAGQLDLAVVFALPNAADTAQIMSSEVAWWGDWNVFLNPPGAVPLVVINSPCYFRDSAIRALESAGMKWRIALSSDNLSGVWAATQAGMGVTALAPILVPARIKKQGCVEGLPPINDVGVFLRVNSHTPHPAISQLESILRNTLQAKTALFTADAAHRPVHLENH
jgi:DNA-binding transcriptional LysR family regulator